MNTQKPVKLASDLFQCADLNKTGALIKMNALTTGLRNSRNERMKPKPARLFDNGFLQLAANASVSICGVDEK